MVTKSACRRWGYLGGLAIVAMALLGTRQVTEYACGLLGCSFFFFFEFEVYTLPSFRYKSHYLASYYSVRVLVRSFGPRTAPISLTSLPRLTVWIPV